MTDHRSAKNIKSTALKSAEASMKKIVSSGTMNMPDLKGTIEMNPKQK
jgi:hypothetical protein